jgi:hypothetical protein
MRKTGICIGALFLATAAVAATEPASAPDTQFKEEFQKQDRIYHARGVMSVEGYTTDRSLLGYALMLHPEFDGALAKLDDDHRWLDIGAGEGKAVLDYFSSRYDIVHGRKDDADGKAQAVAISIEDRRSPLWHEAAAGVGSDRIRYLHGKSLRDYTVAELGRFEIISDVFGGFSYARDLSLFVEKATGFLQPQGSFYTVLQDVRVEDRSNRPHYEGSPFLTEILAADGSEQTVCAWLKSISCVEVLCQAKAAQPPIETYRVRKVCDAVKVPPLQLIHYAAGTPPERRYKLIAIPAGSVRAPGSAGLQPLVP